MKLSRKTVVVFSLRLMVAYTLVSVIVFFGAYRITEYLMPAIKLVIKLYGTEHKLTDVTIGGTVGHVAIHYTIEITKHLTGISIPLIESMTNGITSSILFVPHIIFYSLLFAWPGLTWKHRLAATLISIPVMAGFFVLDAAMTVVSAIEFQARSKLQGIAVDHAITSDALYYLSHFFNNGGRQFMGVLLFIMLVVPMHLKSSGIKLKIKPRKKITVGRNDPCFCGSGKKYKNCCGKRGR